MTFARIYFMNVEKEWAYKSSWQLTAVCLILSFCCLLTIAYLVFTYRVDHHNTLSHQFTSSVQTILLAGFWLSVAIYVGGASFVLYKRATRNQRVVLGLESIVVPAGPFKAGEVNIPQATLKCFYTKSFAGLTTLYLVHDSGTHFVHRYFLPVGAFEEIVQWCEASEAAPLGEVPMRSRV